MFSRILLAPLFLNVLRLQRVGTPTPSKRKRMTEAKAEGEAGHSAAEMTKSLLDGLLGYSTGPHESLEDTLESLAGRLDATNTNTAAAAAGAQVKGGQGTAGRGKAVVEGALRDVGVITGIGAPSLPPLLFQQNLHEAAQLDLNLLQRLMPPPPSRDPKDVGEGLTTQDHILRAFPIVSAPPSGRRNLLTNLPMPAEGNPDPEFSEAPGSTVLLASALSELQQRLHVYEAASILVEQRSSSQAQTIEVLQKIIRGMVVQWRDLVTRMQNAVADHDGAIHRLSQKVSEAESRAAEAMSLAKKSTEEVVDLRESLVQLVRVVEGQEAARQRLEGAVLGGDGLARGRDAPSSQVINPPASDATK